MGFVNCEKVDSCHNLKSLQKQEILDYEEVGNYYNEV